MNFNIRKYKESVNKYKCKECGTTYHTPELEAPPSPNWADGHLCVMERVPKTPKQQLKKAVNFVLKPFIRKA